MKNIQSVGNRITFPDDVSFEVAVQLLGEPVATLLYAGPKTPTARGGMRVVAVNRETKTITMRYEE